MYIAKRKEAKSITKDYNSKAKCPHNNECIKYPGNI